MTGSFWLPRPEGNDPYDALLGSRVPGFVRSSPRLRQLAIQVRKRLPIDVGPLLGTRPFVMAKAVGCLLWAEARVCASEDIPSAERAERLVSLLDSTTGNAGNGAWGYEFDVQTRWAHYQAGSPNLIATSFVGRGMLAAGLVFDRPEWLERGIESAVFAVDRLARPVRQGGVAFHYTLETDHLIHNANLLGCALCVDAGAVAGDDRLREVALRAARTSVAAQAEDGSWPYGDTPALAWVDSFHTAYDLDGLLQVWLVSRDEGIRTALVKGTEFWASRFFGPNGEPHYFSDRHLPYDIHSAATAVDVGARLALAGFVDPVLPMTIADWTQAHLIDASSGRTYYREHRLFTDRRSFVRWGDAHWALARASLETLTSGRADPVESRLGEGA